MLRLVTPVSLLANLLIVPLSSLALMASLGSLICGTWCAPLTELFNHSAWFWMECMVSSSAWLAALPEAYFYTRPPSGVFFVAYYSLLCGVASGWLPARILPPLRDWVRNRSRNASACGTEKAASTKRNLTVAATGHLLVNSSEGRARESLTSLDFLNALRKGFQGFAGSSLRYWAGAMVALVCWGVYFATSGENFRLMVLPLGGAGIFVDSSKRAEGLLIDSGDRSAAEFVLKPFLRAQGVGTLPRLLLTHGDVRHVGGSEYLAQQFSIKRILTSGLRFRSPVYRALVARLERTPEKWKRVHRGDRVGLWQVLHPAAADRVSQADDGAIVLFAEIHGVRILLLSDLGRVGQRTLLEREQDLRADIVVTGLPAQGEPLNDSLLQQLQPRVIIVASAEHPISSRVGLKIRKRLSHSGARILCTDEFGAVTVTARPGGCEIHTANGDSFRLGPRTHHSSVVPAALPP